MGEMVVSGPPQGALPGIDGETRFLYVLRHGDDNLVLAQRLGEWISRAPELEEDIALANIALDHLGQARALLTYAGELEGRGRSEDDLAMTRTERQFTNLLLCEQPNEDFAHTMARQLFIDAYQLELWERLASSNDPTLAGIAAKAWKEARYHFRHSSTWVIRLGDGTEESHHRMQRAIDELWRFTTEPFMADDVDRAAAGEGYGVDPSELEEPWLARVTPVLQEAGLVIPTDPYRRVGGRQGFHTEHLGHLLAEMQWMARTYPGLEW
ncbi:MAG: phenylacetic acid degradation protein [Acidimicrobiia bacterium]|nr:MAG: phenylacetic acid degradation protein [Acidimicrobiia bacterium]